MKTLAGLARVAAALALLCVAGGAARADIKVDVKQDPTTKLWRYAYTIQHDDAIKSKGPGDIEEVRLTTRDLMGVDVPIMTLLPEGWSINWEVDEDEDEVEVPSVVWGNYDEKFELKPGGPAVTFVLFSPRAPADATLTVADEADNEAEFTVQGPTGE
jgi:hypothetical protein